MPYISPDDTNTIISRTENKLLDVVGDFVTLHKNGSVSYKGDCPLCKGADKLEVNPGKSICKCFSCGAKGAKTPVSFLMTYELMSYPEALEHLARHIGMVLPDGPPQKKATKPVKKASGIAKKEADSFCSRMLAESGLTTADIRAKVFRRGKDKSEFHVATFRKGTVDEKGMIDPKGDDVIIEYYDLDGNPIMYDVLGRNKRPTGERREYFRVRWQYPDEHKDKDGKAGKYKSPYGGGTHLYIPQRIRDAWKTESEITRLFVQEGEKKAEKACKHGIMSVGISGIQNLGQQGRLPEDLIRIIQTCRVKEVVFLLDSDWNSISANLRVTDDAMKRPRNFFYAVKNFKDYCDGLKNREIWIDVYFGHVNRNEADDKGIDDLLTNTLNGREQELVDDINLLVNEKNLTGKHLTFYKITTATDNKIMSYWHLDHPARFAEAHKEILRNMPEFKLGKHKWRFNEEGEFESAQPLESDEQYWEEIEQYDKSGNPRKHLTFNYNRCFKFLQNRGFGRYRKIDNSVALIRIEPPTVRIVEAFDIRDFVTEFTKSVASEDVLNMLYRGGPQYLGPDKLSNLNFIQPSFREPSRDKQVFFFEDNCWEVNEDGIQETDYTKIHLHIWANKKSRFSVKKTGPLIQIERDPETKHFRYKLTDTGRRCHFLQFLINASNFTWRKEKIVAGQGDDIDEANRVVITEEERQDNIEHLIAKMSAIGYMLMEAKDRSVSRAVVAMDGKQSEVGASNGRSGKSIIGEMFKHLMPSFYINGKTKDIQGDQFVWNDLVEGMRCCFIDDVRPNFDFEFLFANITGDWNVNYKGGGRATFPFNISPKIYLTTNHALNGDGSSFLDRQWLIAFSDFYNNEHKPVDDFGALFFDEWDYEQWNLHWNLMAECIRTYLRFGVVEAPGERLEARRLRQQVGESFILWADEFFSDDEKINVRIPRSQLYKDEFLEYAPDQRKWITAPIFKKKFINYCALKGYIFNPGRYDASSGLPMFFDKDGQPVLDDKSGGVEYFSILPEKDFKARAASPLDILKGRVVQKDGKADAAKKGKDELPF